MEIINMENRQHVPVQLKNLFHEVSILRKVHPRKESHEVRQDSIHLEKNYFGTNSIDTLKYECCRHFKSSIINPYQICLKNDFGFTYPFVLQ